MLLQIEDKEVLDLLLTLLVPDLLLNLLSKSVAEVVFEETGVLERVNLISMLAQLDVLVRQIFQVDDTELLYAIELSNVKDSLSVVANTELHIPCKRRHSQGRVLQAGVAHSLATSAPDCDGAEVVSPCFGIVHTCRFHWASQELNRRNIEHVSSVLSVLAIFFTST